MKKTDLKQLVSEKVEGILSDVYKIEGVQSGDITPSQSQEWDKLIDQLTDLFTDLVEQNKGGNQ